MDRTISNTFKSFQRYLFVFAALLVMLLSSCSVKANIKTLVGIPAKTERGLPKGNQSFSINTLEKCSQFEAANNEIVQKISIGTKDLLPVVTLTSAFLFPFSFHSENGHPLYSGSVKIHNSIPLFLEYRKLLIHFSH